MEKESYKIYGNYRFKFKSDDGFDTKVFINDNYICSIAFRDIDFFFNDITNVLKKFAI